MSKFALASMLLSTAAPLGAQTGPFTDGELLVRARNPVNQLYTLYRIDPLSGVGAPLVEAVSASGPGWMAHDPYRDGLLLFTSYLPFGLFEERLVLVRANGEVSQLGYLDAQLSALTPVGDGRVYLMAAGVLSVLDATNQLSPVLDELGQVVDLPFEHLLYHAPSNALIGAVSGGGASVPCGSTFAVTVHRLPLAADGLSLAGPTSCGGYPMGFGSAVVGLDALPNGNVLLTQADGFIGNDDQLYEVDPQGLSVQVWASPFFSDIDGGVWAQTLGAAVVLDDFANALKTFGFGGSGAGSVLPVTVPVGDSNTGWSATNNMTDIDIDTPPCPGAVAAFGQGLGGTGGRVPVLGVGGCPQIGEPLPVTIGNCVGASFALVAVTLDTLTYPLLGGTGYLLPPFLATSSIVLDGTAGEAGNGFGQSLFSVPDNPNLIGLTIHAQGFVVDGQAIEGVALTQGLAVTIG